MNLRDRLQRRAGDAATASIAFAPALGAAIEAAWIPDLAEEPAFLAYSITKTFTAALALGLCEKGVLRLDDELARWFPEIDRAREISIRQLLGHTAGIPDYGPLPAYHQAVRRSPSVPWTFERYAAETFEKGLLFAPGGGFSYSNPGYMLVKRILEIATGASFRSLIAAGIAGPLGLRRTFVAESIDDLAGLAPAPSKLLSAGGVRDTRAHYHPGWVSHGVIASTASDIVRFFDGLFGGSLLAKESVAAMLDARPLTPGDEHAYGLGLMAASGPGQPFGHNGGGPGYTASAFHDPSTGATACVMAAVEEGFDAQALVLETLPVRPHKDSA